MALSRQSHGTYASTPEYGTGSYTTGSFTPQSNSLLVVFLSAGSFDGSQDISDSLTITDSAGLTWTKRVVAGNAGSFDSSAVVWTAPVSTAAAMTITFDCGAISVFKYRTHVFSFTGYNTSSPVGATAFVDSGCADGVLNLTLSASTASDSEVPGLISEAVDGVGTYGVTEGSGYTELYDVGVSNEWWSQSQVRTASTSTAYSWADIKTGTGTVIASAAVALEIKAAAAGGTAVPVFMHHLNMMAGN